MELYVRRVVARSAFVAHEIALSEHWLRVLQVWTRAASKFLGFGCSLNVLGRARDAARRVLVAETFISTRRLRLRRDGVDRRGLLADFLTNAHCFACSYDLEDRTAYGTTTTISNAATDMSTYAYLGLLRIFANTFLLPAQDYFTELNKDHKEGRIGNIRKVELMYGPPPASAPLGKVEVSFQQADAAYKAVDRLKNLKIDNKPIHVSLSPVFSRLLIGIMKLTSYPAPCDRLR